MTDSRVRHWEGYGDLTVLEDERAGSPLDTRGLEPAAGALCLLLTQGYFRNGRFVARHYLSELDLAEAVESRPQVMG